MCELKLRVEAGGGEGEGALMDFAYRFEIVDFIDRFCATGLLIDFFVGAQRKHPEFRAAVVVNFSLRIPIERC